VRLRTGQPRCLRTPHDRGKGAIDLDGAIDVSFVVTVKGSGLAKVFTLACTGANDGEEGPVTSFRLESVALGTDADGKPTTAPVVVQADVVVCDGSNLKGNAARAMDALERAIEEHGVCPPDGSVGFPDGVATVTRDQWRDQFYADAKAKEPNVEENTLRQRLLRARTELIDAEKVLTLKKSARPASGATFPKCSATFYNVALTILLLHLLHSL
jgi:hypothetical protein